AAWSPMIHRQSHAFVSATTSDQMRESSDFPMQEAFKRAAVEPIRLIFEPRPQFSPMIALSASIYFIPWLLIKRRPELLFWILWLSCAVGFALALDVAKGTRYLAEIRHTSLAGPAVYALLPAILAGQRPLLRNGLSALIALACLGPLGLAYSHFAENYQDLGHLFDGAKNTDEPIVFYSIPPLDWWSDVMLLGASHYSGVFPRTIVRLDEPASPQLLAQLHRWPSFWLVWELKESVLQKNLPGSQITWVRTEPYLAQVAHVRWIDDPTKTAPTTKP
ncbi:MAG TPA: hypothetical protein VKK61_11225, partial [Tepidisphaeraceae bacterium]|nr:hypothetical protein [Tepidisphaeraceae bacterium]